MQLLPFKAMQQRLLFNWSVSYAEQLDKGNSYADLKPSIMICFADYDVFPGRSGWHSRFRAIDSEGRLFCHDLEFHVLELPKFNANPNIVATPLEQWLFFLREAVSIDPEHCPSCLTLPTIHKAIEELNMISLNEADHELYRARRKQALDERSLRYDAISEGKEIGIEIGIEIGLIASRIHSLEALLGREPTPVAQLRLRTTDELLRIETELKAKLANRS